MTSTMKNKDWVDSKTLDDPPLSPTEVWSDFCDYTSTHGPSHVKRVKNTFGKLVWLVAILTFTGVLLWQLVILIKNFARFDHNVLLEVKFNKSLEFPAVTICNLNPYRKSRFLDVINSNQQLKEYFQELTNSRNTSAQTDYNDQYDYWNHVNIDYAAYDQDYTEEHNVREIVNTFDETTKTYIGHRLQSMLLSCKYGGRACSIKNFTESWNNLYGNCFTFYGESTEVNTAGPAKGLEIEMYIQLGEYMPSISKRAGLKVLVHDPNRVPFPDKDGITISAGFSTDIGMRMLEIKRLGSPYYDCLPQTTSGRRNIYSHQDKYGESYSLDVCEISCYQYALIGSCDCVDSSYPSDHPEMPANISYCFLTNSLCAKEVFENYTSGVLECKECVQVCSETKFFPTISSSVWPTPSDAIMAEFREELSYKRNPEIQTWLETHNAMPDRDAVEDIRNNVARMVLFYEDLNYERIVQTPAFTTISFISNLGGLFGLWIGMSVLSLCEWLEFLLRVMIACMKNKNAVDQHR